ncbi:unnamed protein product [Rotaria sp. Silwood1]|nr:unnamed protein product [Rotaria sp. Silwood1]
MTSGVHFSVDMKKLIFRVIKFVENEKTGLSIPLYNCNARLVAMLGISEGALLKLKKELTAAQNAEEQEYRPPRLRSQSKVRPVSKLKRRSSSLGLSSAPIVVPEPEPTKKRSGRVPIKLLEQADSEIRFQFHALLAENIYPNTDYLLERLHQLHNDFTVQSKTTLRRHLHRIGFSYKSNAKVNEIAMEFKVEIVRLPVRHCCFNPIELCWADLKEYVRKGNTRFQLTDVRELAAQFIASYDGDVATKVIKRTQEIENKFKIADRYIEENIEPMLDGEESSDESDVVSSNDA